MEKKENSSRRPGYIALTSVILAVLAAISSFQANTFSSQMLFEKNSSIILQSKANRQWNSYLADNITVHLLQNSSPTTQNKKPVAVVQTFAKEQTTFQTKAIDLEKQSDEAANRAHVYFAKNSNMTTAGTFFDIALALTAIGTLIKRKYFLVVSLLPAIAGLYFLIIGLI